MKTSTDVLIIGSGMVGLSIAWELLEQQNNIHITVVDKEINVGRHGSGRNSGVLHAGIYYSPGSLKAKVCVNGAKRLREWCESERLPMLRCGKIITPQDSELDGQLDVLHERGLADGATVEIIDQQQFQELAPNGRTSAGRVLWSVNTCVVKPSLVMQRLKERPTERGVTVVMSQNCWKVRKLPQLVRNE